MSHYRDIDIPENIRRLRDRSEALWSRGGTAAWIDHAAVSRGLRSLRDGRATSLARPLQPGRSIRNDSAPAFSSTLYVEDEGTVEILSDHLEIDCHGYLNTHVDGLSHFAVDGTFYDGSSSASVDARPSVDRWGDTGLITRCVMADIPTARGTPWVDPTQPVTAEDIERSLDGTTFHPGDALLMYMGRDRYEAAGETFTTAAESPNGRPGVGASGANWIADQHASVVCWDMMDAVHPREPLLSVHLLIWAIGLVLVDNCDLGSARDRLHEAGRRDGMLVVAPLKISGGTASPVNPLLLT